MNEPIKQYPTEDEARELRRLLDLPDAENPDDPRWTPGLRALYELGRDL